MSVKQEAVNRQAATKRIVCRLTITVFITSLGLLALFPWGNGYVPEGNLLAGPLWLLKTHSRTDFQAGCSLICVLVPMISAIGIRMNAFTVTLCIMGLLLWIGIGIHLGINAVV